MKLKAAALTDVGQVRDTNKDVVFQKVFDASDDDPVGLFVVADGVGGHLAGQDASYWTVETIKKSLSDLIAYQDPHATDRFSRDDIQRMQVIAAEGITLDSLQKRVEMAVQEANRAVYGYTRHLPDGAHNASSTLCLALVYGLQVIVTNVGDSRAYLLRDGQLKQITEDHSVVQRMIDEGELEPEASYTHPQRHLIYRSLGSRDTVEQDIFTLTLATGDYLLLCTDGLWEMVPDDALVSIVDEAASIQVACRQLVNAANTAGGHDNIGVVLARICG